MTNQNIELVVSGRVQGVYYRKTIQLYAQQNNINGFVENLKNGSVHIIASGTLQNLETFIQLCKKGSFFSRVKNIERIDHTTYPETYQAFSIRKTAAFLPDQVRSFSRLITDIMTKTDTTTTKQMVTPKHVVIIPNGNRTWAKKQGLQGWAGYHETYKNLDSIMKEAKELGIAHMTLWGFSTENWKRSAEETKELFKVVLLFLKQIEKKLISEKIQFNHLGRKDRLPKDILETITRLEKATQSFTEKSINLALDYGGRDEIIRAINTALQSGKKEITEEEFSGLLDTKNIPDPDLIIRTANEKRMSGMMPWQATYAEYYFADIYFPEFTGEELRKAVIDFSTRKRTFGGDINHNKKTN